MCFMNQNYETALKQPSSYVSPLIRVVEIEISQLLCQSEPQYYNFSTDTDSEINEMP